MRKTFLALAVFLASFSASPGFSAHLGSVQYYAGYVAANPLTNRVYGTAQGVVYVYDEASNSVSQVIVDLTSFVVDPVNNKIYGPIRNQNAIAIVDGATHAVTPVALPAAAVDIAVNTVTGKLYVATPANNRVAVVDLATLAVDLVPVGTNPSKVVVDAGNNRVYAAAGSTVTVIDGATLATTPLTMAGPVKSLAVNDATHRIFVVHETTGVFQPTLTAIDATTLAMNSVAVAAYPNVVVVNSLSDRVYVGSAGIGNLDAVVAIVNGTTLAKTDVANHGAYCCNAVVNMTGHEAYVASTGFSCNYCVPSGPTTVVDGDSDAVTSVGGASSITVNAVTNRVYRTTGYQGGGGAGFYALSAAAGFAARPNGLTTAIASIPGNSTGSLNPQFTFTPATTSALPIQRVYYQMDGTEGPWTAATKSGNTWTGHTGTLPPGAHTIYAFAVDARSAVPTAPMVGEMATYAFTVTSECVGTTCVDLSVAHSVVAPTSGFTQKDIAFQITASNPSTTPATNVVLTDVLPPGSSFIWASPSCTHNVGTVTCPVGTLAGGATAYAWVVARPTAVGTATNTASVSATEHDPQTADNQSVANVPVTTSPAGVPKLRYRLYSPVTLEHHFTTDLNEYNVLGSQAGTWVQEGTVGKVLDNPGSFNSVEAVPYYRMYDSSTQWHHWTTDANEYYTLAMYPWWYAEGVDGWILPTSTAGTTELFRLNYPAIPGLHHWTIDPVEYNQLITNYGWVGEGGSGFVVQ